MLIRKIDSFLDNFYKSTNKSLLVTGARQTGKSFSIRQFEYVDTCRGVSLASVEYGAFLRFKTFTIIFFPLQLLSR